MSWDFAFLLEIEEWGQIGRLYNIAWFSMGAWIQLNESVNWFKEISTIQARTSRYWAEGTVLLLGIFWSTGFTENKQKNKTKQKQKQKGWRPVSLSLKHDQFKPTAREKTAHTNKLINLVRLGFNEVRPKRHSLSPWSLTLWD